MKFIMNFWNSCQTSYYTYLLSVFNNIWINGCIPDTWKQATIIPILKSVGNSPVTKNKRLDPPLANFQMIAWTSFFCKTRERIIKWDWFGLITLSMWFLKQKSHTCTQSFQQTWWATKKMSCLLTSFVRA